MGQYRIVHVLSLHAVKQEISRKLLFHYAPLFPLKQFQKPHFIAKPFPIKMKNKECPTRKKKTGKGKQKKQEEKRVATEGAVNKIFCPQIMKNPSPAHSQTTKAEFCIRNF